jgi:hypothetical protein
MATASFGGLSSYGIEISFISQGNKPPIKGGFFVVRR